MSPLYRISATGSSVHIFTDGPRFYRIEMAGESVPEMVATARRCDPRGTVEGGPLVSGHGPTAYADCLKALGEFVQTSEEVFACTNKDVAA